MSKPNGNTPNSPYGSVTGIPTPDPENGVLTPSSCYASESTPGTADHAYPQHVEGGVGHADCDHD